MTRSSELSQRILSELEEPFEDNVFALLNSVGDGSGEQKELSGFIAALGWLVESDLVIAGLQRFIGNDRLLYDKQQSAILIGDLERWFRFDDAEGFWTLREGDIKTEKKPFIRLTELGLEEAGRVLDQRGYRWWDRDAR